MTDHHDLSGLDDPEIALRRETETLAQRFPDVEKDEISDRVESAYQELKDSATVDAHLVAMTENKVTEDLRRDGAEVHVRGEDVD